MPIATTHANAKWQKEGAHAETVGVECAESTVGIRERNKKRTTEYH